MRCRRAIGQAIFLVGSKAGRIVALQDENMPLREHVAALRVENWTLRGEVARLKALPRRPPDKPSTVEPFAQTQRLIAATWPSGSEPPQSRERSNVRTTLSESSCNWPAPRAVASESGSPWISRRCCK